MPAHAAIRSHRLPIWPLVALAAVVAVIVSMLVATSARGATVALSGVVHNASGTALSGVTVSANYQNSGAPVTTTTKSSSTGAFAFAALTPGEYTLSFSATSTTYFQYLGDTSDPTQAEILSLDATTEGNGSVYLPVDLAASGSLTGKVEITGGAALRSYTVRAYKQNDDGSWSIAMTAVTGSTGIYSMSGLEPIFYHLEALDTTSAHPLYAPTFSGGATTVAAATAVGVLAGKTSSYNFALGSKGSVSGTVTGTGSVPLAGVRVTAYSLVGTSSPFDSATALDSPTTTTAANGAYQLTGLLPGNYTLEFQPPTSAYGRTFLGNSDSAVSAQYFPIANGTSVNSQNITLVAGATISGVIENESSSATLPDIEVIADYVGGNPDAPAERAESTVTASDGTFSLTGLGPGNYDLYIGSNASLDPSHPAVGDTSWIRQQVAVGPLTAGEDLTSVSIGMTAKVDGGMVSEMQPTISGGSSVGDTVSTNGGTWTSTPSSYSYQWYSSNVAIAGATGSSYVLRPGDVGHIVTVRVTASNFSYGSGTAMSSGTPYVALGTIIAPSPAATIQGTDQVGNVLTAVPTNWGISGISFIFDWQTSPDGSVWNTLGLPSSPTLDLTSAVYATGSHVRVQVFGNRDGYNSGSAYATLGAPIATGTITMIKAPTVEKVGGDYELAGGTFSPSGTTVPNAGVQWIYETSSGGGGSTDTTTPPVSQFTGDYVYASEERQLTGYSFFTTPNILVQTGPAPTATGSTAISGLPAQVGQFMDAPNLNWSNSSGTITHQWQYKSGSTWRNIVGATNTGYSPVAADLGRILRVLTIDTNTGFATGTQASQPTAAVEAGVAANFIMSHTTGTVGTGDPVTVEATWDGSPTTLGYQWEYSATGSAPYTKIAGATQPSYTIPQGLLGKSLFVLESAATPGYLTGSNLQPLGVVKPDQLTLVKAPTVKLVGSLYVVTPPTFSPSVPAASISYAWAYYSENDVDPAQVGSLTTNTADLDAVQPNAHWVVSAYVQNGADGSYSYLYPPAILAKKGNIVPSGPITLPSSNVGVAIVPPAITWLVENPTLSYQWQYLSGSHWLSISAAGGGHGATFIPSSTYLGHELRVITTASRTNYNTASVTSTTTTVAEGAQLQPGTASAAPQISGSVDIGQKLTAMPGTWSQSGATFHYQWAVGTDDSTFTSIPGATSSTYVIPNAAYNTDYYQVTISASKAGFTGNSTTVKTTTLPGKGTIVVVKQPTVKLVHGTYSVVGGEWSPSVPAANLSYQWVDVDPATDAPTGVGNDPSYTPLVPEELGHLIEVEVFPNATNYVGSGDVLVARDGGPIEPLTTITLPQNAVEGANLSLNMTSWSTDNPTVHILWYRNGKATGTHTDDMTYTLGAADVGTTISAHVIASKTDYIGTTIVVSSTPTLSDVVLSASVAPTITGTVAADDTVTAHPGTWNVAGLTYSYQWLADDLAIPGATSSSYTIGGAYDGQDLSVAVTASKAFYSPSSPAVSGSATILDGLALVDNAANPITISGLVGGNVELGHTVTATVASKWNYPVSLTYQWAWVDPIFPENIDGANGASFLPLNGDTSNPPVGSLGVGSRLFVVVTASRPGHASVQISSAEYDVVS